MFALKVVEENKEQLLPKVQTLCRKLIVVYIDVDEFVQIFNFFY